jgi:hypothetical protein
MIAPVREPRDSTSGLATARRAVAAALLGRTRRQPSSPPRVSNRLAWGFVAWITAVAVAYFALPGWWTELY